MYSRTTIIREWTDPATPISRILKGNALAVRSNPAQIVVAARGWNYCAREVRLVHGWDKKSGDSTGQCRSTPLVGRVSSAA